MTDVTAPEPVATPPAPTGPRLGWRVEHRPRPGFAHVLGAAAGVFAVVAVVAFVVEVSGDDPTAPGVGFTLVLIAAAKLLGFKAPGPLRSACTAALVLAVPVLWLFAFAGGGSLGRSEYRGILLLTTASYALLYFLSWTKGRAIFLVGMLVVLTSWLAFEASGNGGTGLAPFQDQVSATAGSSTSFDLGSAGDSSNAAAAVTMLLGLAYLGVGAALDRKRYAGAATPCIGVGAYETITGAIALGAQESLLLGGLLAIAAGTVVGLVAARGENRRATTWIGVIAVFGGMVAVIADIAPSSAAGVGGIAAAFAIGLGLVAWVLAPVLGEPDDGAPADRVAPS
jgi:hypothetical protein